MYCIAFVAYKVGKEDGERGTKKTTSLILTGSQAVMDTSLTEKARGMYPSFFF